MKVKLAQIVNSSDSLLNLMKTKLPVKISYKLSKLAFNIEPELKIYNEQKNALITELGAEDPETKQMTIKQDSPNWPKFMEELNKLAAIEIDLKFSPDSDLEKIKVEELGDVQLEPNDLILLDWLFE